MKVYFATKKRGDIISKKEGLKINKIKKRIEKLKGKYIELKINRKYKSDKILNAKIIGTYDFYFIVKYNNIKESFNYEEVGRNIKLSENL